MDLAKTQTTLLREKLYALARDEPKKCNKRTKRVNEIFAGCRLEVVVVDSRRK